MRTSGMTAYEYAKWRALKIERQYIEGAKARREQLEKAGLWPKDGTTYIGDKRLK